MIFSYRTFTPVLEMNGRTLYLFFGLTNIIINWKEQSKYVMLSNFTSDSIKSNKLKRHLETKQKIY